MTAVVIAVAALVLVGLVAYDWFRAGRLKRALGRGESLPASGARRRTSASTDQEVVRRQADSTRNQSSGPGL